MPNPDFAEDKKGLGGTPPTKAKKHRGGTLSLKERPAFGQIGVPGKTQPKDRSAGIKRVRQHPMDVGI